MEKPEPKPVRTLSYISIPKAVKTVVLSKIFDDLHNASNLHELLGNIDRIIREESTCLAVLISTYDPYREELVYHSSKSGFVATDFKLKLGEGLAGRVGATQTSLYVETLGDFGLSKLIYETLGIQSQRVLAIPLSRRKALLGVIEVIFAPRQPALAQEALEYLDGLSHQMAIALNYFKRSEQLERKSLEEEKLAQVSQRISASLDMDELLDIVIDALRSLIPYDAAGIYLLEKRSDEIQRMVVYGYRPNANQDGILEVGRRARQLVQESQAATILKDLSRFPWYVTARSTARSAMVAPILSNNRLIGVFTLESDEQNVYTGNDLALFEKFTHQT